MSVRTTATTTLGVVADAPATFDKEGYEDLTFVDVGEITNFGEFGREFNLVTHNPVGSRGTQKMKGSFNEGSMALQLGLDNDDAGQVLMKAASLSDANYSFCITTANGDKYYFQGMVMTWKVALNDVDSVTSASATIEITTSSDGTGIVEALAA